MAGEVEGYDGHSQLRISDGDRHQVAEFLRTAAGEGRLDLHELDERLEAAYAAKVYADLVPIVADLPGTVPGTDVPTPPRPVAPEGIGRRYDTSIALMSSQDRKGLWEVGHTHHALALMGSIVLDLRGARLTSHEVVINANAVMGSVDVVVDAGTRVSVEGFGVMGSFQQSRDRVEPEVDAGSPLVRVRGIALMGSVNVVRKPMPGERRRKLLGR